MKIHVIPALTDNYNFILVDSKNNSAACVDPSETKPIDSFLIEHNLRLDYILNTHHHFDHIGGNSELKKKYNCKVFGSRFDFNRIPNIDTGLQEGDQIEFAEERATVLEIPGHTLGHIAYYFPNSKALFCGDTIFSLGCGRLFEGTPEQMWNSIQKLRSLPSETKIYCAHEYTLANADFALWLDPENTDLKNYVENCKQRRNRNLPTIPTDLKTERSCNPFLRVDDESFASLSNVCEANPISAFAKIRSLKDNF